ncbi:hypothetical protein ACFRCX_30460 [Streptomyces sp. NPDC056652]|uniref:hypothetical protein n=1 Tax=Streptomyces sp. NPDC056652 TaxID=3345893 RepID=UPI0036B10F7A
MTAHRDPYGPVHTAGNAVPPLDDQLAGLLDDTAGIHPGIDLIREGLGLLALDRHTPDQTQTILYTLAGADGLDLTTGIALLVQRLTNPDSNPCLRALPLDRQMELQHLGKLHVHDTADTDRQNIAEAISLIDP